MAAIASRGYPSSPSSLSLTGLSPISSLVLDNSIQFLEAFKYTEFLWYVASCALSSLSHSLERRRFSLFCVLSQSHSSAFSGELPGDMKDYSLIISHIHTITPISCPFLSDSKLLRLGFTVYLCFHQTPKEEKRSKIWQGKVKFWLKTLNPLERMGSLKSCEERG